MSEKADGTASDNAPSGAAPKVLPNDEDFKAARWLFGQVLAVNSTAKRPNWNGWATDVRLMRERDGRTHKEMCELFQWAKNDSFWAPNIQSPAKLREKWDQLTEQRARSEKAAKAAKSSAWWASNESILAKAAEVGVTANPGESMATVKARVDAAIANGGKPPPPQRSRVIAPQADTGKSVMPAGLNLKALLVPRGQS